MTGDSAALVADSSRTNGPLRTLTRLGFILNGVVHALIGVVAIAVALGAGEVESGAEGALGTISATSAGNAVFWSIAIGLCVLGLWQIVRTVLEPVADPANRWSRRISQLSVAAAYLAVAIVALLFAGDNTGGGSLSPTPGARILALPGGVVILTVIGLGVIGIGTAFIVRGAGRRFVTDLAVASDSRGRAVVTLGVVAYIAKGVVLCVVGILLVTSSLSLSQSPATGLDGAMSRFAALPLGALAIAALGVGLFCYALYCGVRAIFARV